MKQVYFLILFIFSVGLVRAQKIDSLFFNLYTDSLKKGSWNYINVDAKLSNGSYMPLTSEQLNFKVSNGKLQGNSVWIGWEFTDDSVVVEVSLKKDVSVRKSITIWIKKKDEQLNAPLNDSLLQQINDRPKTPRKKRKN
ncbi:hypothetical protein [Lacibacter sediminis]|uniref:Uncharacterized protein n=1 Tax=Lacibacter sediminis TaxID=2760713 RepID=A0A7G5XB86_9BACT|nr:hypothetical protein [Lacibacter sediminis]QNA42739.1 hypothetical protein H4075_11565 [Lacibacter sediminis]